MWMIRLAVLVSGLGFITAAFSLVLLSRAHVRWLEGKRPRDHEEDAPVLWGPGLLLVLIGGSLLVFGGQYKLASVSYDQARRAAERAAEAEARAAAQAAATARLQVILQDPLELFWVHCDDADPIRDRPDACALWLRFHRPLGGAVISRVAARQLRVPGASFRDDPGWHALPWEAVLDGVQGSQGPAAAAHLRAIKDLRRFDRVDLGLVAREPEQAPRTRSVTVLAGPDGAVEVFSGSLAPACPPEAVGRLLAPVPSTPLQALPVLAVLADDGWWAEVPAERSPAWGPEAVGGLLGYSAGGALPALAHWAALPAEATRISCYRDALPLPARLAAFEVPAPEAPAADEGGPGLTFGVCLLVGVFLSIAGANLARPERWTDAR